MLLLCLIYKPIIRQKVMTLKNEKKEDQRESPGEGRKEAGILLV